jgi:uncharacterized protein (DUF433 family)
MDWHDYISVDPNIIFGKPAVKGTRLGVELILDFLAAGWTEEMLFEAYPGLTPEALRAIYLYGADLIAEWAKATRLVEAR